MINLIIFLFFFSGVVNGSHFNGGTIRWEPINPTINSSVVPITIIQTYSWTYPLISCATDVPISTSGRSSSNANLTCVTDCSTNGNYSMKPVSILTDCVTASSSLGMMTSQRSVNINLTSDTHFYLGYVGSAWLALNDPAQSGLQWSIVSLIDLRMRPDGIINTPPVASVVSPQYAIVNQTTSITIPVSDVNTGDDVRCRWSTYTPGHRRRKRSDEEDYINQNIKPQIYKKPVENKKLIHNRKKRGWSFDPCYNCHSTCKYNCLCSCSTCAGTTCGSWKCTTWTGCPIGTTTVETPGTIKPTSSYPNRQPIDECGGICYAQNSLPNGTTLSGCTISFTGLIPNTWYGVSVQVEDFIDSTSNTSMSSVPVQFLIYVMPQPACGLAPIIIPPYLCTDVQVGTLVTFDIFAQTLCNPNVSDIDAIVAVSSISGMNVSNTADSSINASLSYVTITWEPQLNQLGLQQLCVIAYTDEQIQSQQYCITFNVTSLPVICLITTTTSTSTTSETTTTPTSTTTTANITTTTTTKALGQAIDWPLILGLSLLALLLALCCSCCCCYWLLWSPGARRRRQREAEAKIQQDTIIQKITPDTFRKNHHLIRILGIEKIQKKYFNYTALKTRNSAENISLSHLSTRPSKANTRTSAFTITSSIDKNMNLSISSIKQGKPINVIRINNNEISSETGNIRIKPQNSMEIIPQPVDIVTKINKTEKSNATKNESQTMPEEQEPRILPTSKTSRPKVIQVPRYKGHIKRLSSISSINVINLGKPSVTMPSMPNQLQSTSLTKDRKTSYRNSVSVIKIPRNSISK